MPYQEPELNRSGLKPSTTKAFNNHKLSSGDNVFRIMPPFGTNHNGYLFAEVYLHWFTDPAGDNRPLACSKKLERYCPACEQANEVYKKKQELVKEYLDKDGRVVWDALPKELGIRYKNLDDQFKALKAQRNFLYNAMDSRNTIGILRLPKTAADQLGEKIEKALNTMGINPTSLRAGMPLNIRQISTGKRKQDVKYEVDFVYQTEQTPDGAVQKITKSSVPDSVIENFETLAYDIHTLYPVRTAQELKRVMLGDKAVWAEIDAKKAAAKAAAAGDDNDADGPNYEPTTVEAGSNKAELSTTVAKGALETNGGLDAAAPIVNASSPKPTPVVAGPKADKEELDQLKAELGL